MKFKILLAVGVSLSPISALTADPLVTIPYPDAPDAPPCPAGQGDGTFLPCSSFGMKSDSEGGCQAALAQAQNDLSVCQSRQSGTCENDGGQTIWSQVASNPVSGCAKPPGSNDHQVTLKINGRCCNASGSGGGSSTDHGVSCPAGKTEVWGSQLQGSSRGSTCHQAENNALSDVLSQMSQSERNCRDAGHTFVSNLSGPGNGTSCSRMEGSGDPFFASRFASVKCCTDAPQPTPPPSTLPPTSPTTTRPMSPTTTLSTPSRTMPQATPTR